MRATQERSARAARGWLVVAALSGAFTTPVIAQQRDTTKLPPGVELETRYSMRGRPLIAVGRFTGPIPAAGITGLVGTIITSDLGHSDRFEILPVPESMAGQDSVQYAVWNSLNVVYLITGNIEPTAAGYQLSITAHDVVYGTVKQSGTFALPASNSPDFRMASHVASDAIVQWLTGQPGMAATRISFVRLNANGSFDLLSIDADGENMRRVFGSPGAIYSPAWSPDGAKVAYAAREPEGWQLIEREMMTGRTRVIASGRDAILTPAYSADGQKLAYAIWLPGGYEIHEVETGGGSPRRLTDSGGDNMLPTYSPDGSRIAFLSTRTGRHHIFVMNANGTGPRIVTPPGEGVEFNAPDWSPTGNQVALWGQSRGTFQLMVLDASRPAGSQIVQLTSAGDNEDPSFAPDGRHIVYTGSGAGRDGLYVIDTVTGNTRLLVRGAKLRNADWSPSLAGLVGAN